MVKATKPAFIYFIFLARGMHIISDRFPVIQCSYDARLARVFYWNNLFWVCFLFSFNNKK